jgi:hypothetical protein
MQIDGKKQRNNAKSEAEKISISAKSFQPFHRETTALNLLARAHLFAHLSSSPLWPIRHKNEPGRNIFFFVGLSFIYLHFRLPTATDIKTNFQLPAHLELRVLLTQNHQTNYL